MKKMRFAVGILLVLCSGPAMAQQVRLGVDGALAIPVGNFSDTFGVGIGGLLRLEVEPLPGFAITGRSGYIQHLTKSLSGRLITDAKAGELPILAGVKFYTDSGLYGSLEFGGTWWNPSVSGTITGFNYTSSAFYSSAAAGGGLAFGPLDLGVRLHSVDLGHPVDTLQIGITLGFNFFTL
jgi:hypothetical protein